jgi:hypothetical protein
MRDNRRAVSSGDVLRRGGDGLSTIMKASGDADKLRCQKRNQGVTYAQIDAWPSNQCLRTIPEFDKNLVEVYY